jgi:hypothetical protein
VTAGTAEVVIATKLFRPGLRQQTVERKRLHDLLREGRTLPARMHRHTPARSTWRIRMKSSSEYSSSGTYGPGTPALLSAASSLPKAS